MRVCVLVVCLGVLLYPYRVEASGVLRVRELVLLRLVCLGVLLYPYRVEFWGSYACARAGGDLGLFLGGQII